MIGFHALWSTTDGGPSPQSVDDLSLLTLALSALMWREVNGPVYLFCDPLYRAVFEQLGVLDLWDEVDSTALSPDAANGLNRSIFWSFGKLLAFRVIQQACASIDTDLVMWRRLGQDISESDLAFTHWESRAQSLWYPEPSRLTPGPGFTWQPEHLTDVNAANASFLYFGSRELMKEYCEQAFAFATGSGAEIPEGAGVAPELLFAEQCLPTILADHAGFRSQAIVPAVWSPEKDRFLPGHRLRTTWRPHYLSQPQFGVTHLWFWKMDIRESDRRLSRYTKRLACHLDERFGARLASLGVIHEAVKKRLT